MNCHALKIEYIFNLYSAFDIIDLHNISCNVILRELKEKNMSGTPRCYRHLHVALLVTLQ